MKNKINSFYIGFLIGVIIPYIIAFLVMTLLIQEQFYEFWQFAVHPLFPALISLFCLVNFLFFYLANKFELYSLSKGILTGTILYAFIVAWAKLPNLF